MPRNGNGSYSLPQAPFVPGTVISSAAVNSDFSDIAAALTGSVSADGQTPITGVLKSTVTFGPGYTSSLDTTTGFGIPAAGEAVVYANNQTVITVESSGSVADSDLVVTTDIIGETTLTELTVTGGTEQAGTGVTVTSASPAVVTWLAHGFSANQPVYFTAAAIPTGMTAYQIYYVIGGSITTNTFEISATAGGSAVNTTSTGTTVIGYTPATVLEGGTNVTQGMTVDVLTAATANIGNLITTTGFPIPAPQGYLTPVSGTAIIPGDSVSAGVIYYTPYTGNWVAINNGTGIVPYQFSQLALTLSASQAASNIYDIFLAYNGGTPVIGTGPSWAASGGSITAGSCARGTGAGSTAISRSSGFWVNTNSMSLIYNTGSGNVTITVGVGAGIYLGSIYMDGTGGQVSCYRSWGQSRKWGISNAYNRVPVALQVGDSTTSWNYGTATIRPSNNNTANSATIFSGLQEEITQCQFWQNIQGANSVAAIIRIGIGFNSTTALSGYSPIFSSGNTVSSQIIASYTISPSLGINTITSLEVSTNGGLNTFFGAQSNMIMQTQWRV